MSFGDHLEELRKRVILALLVPVPVAVTAFYFAEHIRFFLCEPAFKALKANELPAQLQVLNPAETLSTDMQLSLVVALVVSAPWILWQLWKFIEPGLYASERRFVHLLVPMSAALSVLGLALLQWVLLPAMMHVLVGFGMPEAQMRTVAQPSEAPAAGPAAPLLPVLTQPPEHPLPGQAWITPDHQFMVALPVGDGGTVEILSMQLVRAGTLAQQYRLSEYLDFVLMLMLGTAVAFQLPIVVMLLGWVGIVEVSTLRHYRRHAVLVCAVVSAFITPTGDPISMTLMGLPLYALYELGILLLVVAPPRAVAEGRVLRRVRDVLLGRHRVSP